MTTREERTTASAKLGRPLSFDRALALEKAMHLFWAQGYEGASVAELVSVMGITPPSLYAAFGDKKGLFLAAVNLYRSGTKAGLYASDQVMDEASSAREAARRMLEAAAHHFTGPDTPRGCLLAIGAIACSAGGTDVRNTLAAIRRQTEERLTALILEDISQGRLSDDTDATILASYVMAVIHGMSTLARDGAPQEKLVTLARAVMLGWPEEN